MKHFIIFCFLLTFNNISFSQELDEFKFTPPVVFEFAKPPTIKIIEKDKYEISFEVKEYCDITLVVENSSQDIICCIASGVLGDNAPTPFQKSSKAQTLIWDGKNNKGEYIKDVKDLKIRVSLGLKPQFEKVFLDSKHKRFSNNAPILAVDKEGLYTFEGLGMDRLKMFDHSGNYIKTIFPFPANKIDKVIGLSKHISPKDGKEYPKKLGYNLGTLLTSGSSGAPEDFGNHMGGYGATAMATRNGLIAIANYYVNRLKNDGTSGGLPLTGPMIASAIKREGHADRLVGPTSIAFSPDNKYLYLTGFIYKHGYWEHEGDCFHVVKRIEYNSNEAPIDWKGQNKAGEGYGADNDSLCVPTSVDVDNKGRVYVSDFGNNRIQIFEENGTFLKSIPTNTPAKVFIDPKTQEIYSLSWKMIGASPNIQKEKNIVIRDLPSTITNFGSFDNLKLDAKAEPFPAQGGEASGGWNIDGGQVYQTVVDSYGTDKKIWIAGRKPTMSIEETSWAGRVGAVDIWKESGIKAFQKINDKWEVTISFGEIALKKDCKVDPPPLASQRLYFNPSDNHLYVGEEVGFNKSFDELIKINIETGANSIQDLPFDAADLVFLPDNIALLRTESSIVRFDSSNWKEIPWDYGIEKEGIHFQSFTAPRRSFDAVSVLPIPGKKPVHWQLGGMTATPRGDVAVVCNIQTKKYERGLRKNANEMNVAPPTHNVQNYPGRVGLYIIMVYDRFGKIIYDDAFPGLTGADGIGLDKDLNLYTLMRSARVTNTKKTFEDYSSTLVKIKPKKAHILSPSDKADLVLDKESYPKRPFDIADQTGGSSWVEGYEWMYGGVGQARQACACWHSRFYLDGLARSFATSPDEFQIDILDKNGNIITKVGQYGNSDSAGKDSLVPLPGDGVGLFMFNYVTCDTDKRLFISDTGNGRIISVKLNYHQNKYLEIPAK